jgi:predicted Zn-dependent protease
MRSFLAKAKCALILPLLILLLGVSIAHADNGMPRVNVIRDVEIENTLKSYGEPIWLAAGLNPSSIRVVIVNDSALNAFVAGGMNIFFHTGLLQSTTNAAQLIGVLAHESGHIAGGHLIRGTIAMKEASMQAILSMVVGTAAAVLSGNPSAGAAVMTGGQSVAQRSILSFSRMQESSADAAGMRFLDTAKLTSKGLLEFLQKLSGQELLPLDRQSEYTRTHPLTQDRIDAVREHVDNSPCSDRNPSAEMEEKHRRMQAKLLGFLKPDAALLRYGEKDARVSARYARAIAYYRKGNVDKSLELLNQLLREEPKNPYFYEVVGQILFENARVNEAIPFYEKAVQLLPSAGLIQAAYGHALLETQDASKLDQAIQHLNESLVTEARESSSWRLLATAWGRKQNDGMVAYCLAEEALTNNDGGSAHKWADRALKLLPKGSPYALRAQDIKNNHVEDED